MSDSLTPQTTPSDGDDVSSDDAGNNGGAVPPPCVVGIACSSESLDLLAAYVRNVPEDSGTAIVVLAPDVEDPAALARDLAAETTLPIRTIADRTPLAPHTVFIAPPNMIVRLHNGVLELSLPSGREGATPIDHFFRSTATEKRQRAIGVVLAGDGVDGTLGARAIEAEGGIVLVQEPTTAAPNGLLHSVIGTGIVDYIMPAERMPDVVNRYTKHPYVDGTEEEADAAGGESLQTVLTILRARVGYNFHCYKKNTLARRVQRRMSLGQFNDYAAYAEYLRTEPSELDELFRDLLICVTQFFRDREAWEVLRSQVIQEIVSAKRNDEAIRVWVPGCATGEEAYSIAILLLDELRIQQKNCVLQIFASDINESVLEVARVGAYPKTIADDVPRQYLERYFTGAGGGDHRCVVSKAVRDAVVFAHQNLVADPPFSKLDLVTCRNLLIYLEPEVQQKLIGLFHFALRPGGFLFLGSAETIGRSDTMFTPVSKKWRIYRRSDEARRDGSSFPVAVSGTRIEYPQATASRALAPQTKLARIAQQLVLERFAPAAVLITVRFEIVYFSGPTQDYLTQPTGSPTNDLLTMAREGIRPKLREATARALREGHPVVVDKLRVKRGNASYATKITVSPIRTEHGGEPLLLVVFEPDQESRMNVVEVASVSSDEVRQLEYELQLTREDLQSHIEELETSNEELKASNEEVMSVNEELQSANEELETSKEELQSLNEELSTVNHQLQEKLEELEQTNNDLNNLLSSTEIATLFLDRDLRIKRFTPPVRRLLNIIPSDIGRPIGDFTRRFTDVELLDDARSVLENLTPAEFEVRTEDGRWYLRRVLPYRTEDNRIDGVVITFIDTTVQRLSSIALSESESRYRLLVDSTTDFAIFMMDLEGRISTWNTGAERICGFKEHEAVGRPGSIIFVPEDRATSEHERELDRARREGRSEDERWHMRKDGTRFWGSGVVTLTYDAEGQPFGFTKVMRDQTDRRRMESELKQLNETLEHMVNERTSALRALSSELLLAEERERRDLAGDLHDSIGQSLALAAMRLSEHGPLDDAARSGLLDLINHANEAVRSVTMQLSPPILYVIGLVPALEWLVEEMESRYGLSVALDSRPLPDAIDEQVRFILYRSARELLINVAKHAGVNDARIRIGSVAENIILEVEDSGRGFEATGDRIARREGGFGLFSLRERLGYIGGEVIIRSTPGIGTTVTLRAPIRIQQQQ
jgi:two-component system, chemotaxis family, CheB/CheR fusion protein